MLKRFGRFVAIVITLGTIVAIYLQVRSSVPEAQQLPVLVGLIALAIIVVAFELGYDIGRARGGKGIVPRIRTGQAAISPSTGVLQVVRRRELDSTFPLSDRIEQATSDIFFLGLSLPKLDSYTGALEEKAIHQIHVRLLVPDPCEAWLVKAIARFLHREGPYPKELSWLFSNFYPTWKRAPVYFEVRVHQQIPTLSASVFDAKSGNIEMYMQGVKTDERPILEMDFAKGAANFRESLDRLWAEATPLITDELWNQRIACANAL
ncbi:MAG TPA: hypothetical protein VGR57_20110 [Ktedonobacterales bacterium]|nr:hypothetical protein [Ktedonobacterales bacterium]